MSKKQKPKTPRDRLIASLELKLKNKSKKIEAIQTRHREAIAKEKDEMSLIAIQLEALRKKA